MCLLICQFAYRVTGINKVEILFCELIQIHEFLDNMLIVFILPLVSFARLHLQNRCYDVPLPLFRSVTFPFDQFEIMECCLYKRLRMYNMFLNYQVYARYRMIHNWIQHLCFIWLERGGGLIAASFIGLFLRFFIVSYIYHEFSVFTFLVIFTVDFRWW